LAKLSRVGRAYFDEPAHGQQLDGCYAPWAKGGCRRIRLHRPVLGFERAILMTDSVVLVDGSYIDM